MKKSYTEQLETLIDNEIDDLMEMSDNEIDEEAKLIFGDLDVLDRTTKELIDKVWKPIETAPADGETIELRTVKGYKLLGFLQGGHLDKDENEIYAWSCPDEDHPDCWTDGVCWESNEDELKSDQPKWWRKLNVPNDEVKK